MFFVVKKKITKAFTNTFKHQFDWLVVALILVNKLMYTEVLS